MRGGRLREVVSKEVSTVVLIQQWEYENKGPLNHSTSPRLNTSTVTFESTIPSSCSPVEKVAWVALDRSMSARMITNTALEFQTSHVLRALVPPSCSPVEKVACIT